VVWQHTCLTRFLPGHRQQVAEPTGQRSASTPACAGSCRRLPSRVATRPARRQHLRGLPQPGPQPACRMLRPRRHHNLPARATDPQHRSREMPAARDDASSPCAVAPWPGSGVAHPPAGAINRHPVGTNRAQRRPERPHSGNHARRNQAQPHGPGGDRTGAGGGQPVQLSLRSHYSNPRHLRPTAASAARRHERDRPGNDDVEDRTHITNRTTGPIDHPHSHNRSTTHSTHSRDVTIIATTASTFDHRRRGKPTPRHQVSTPRGHTADAAANAVTPLLTLVDANGMASRTHQATRTDPSRPKVTETTPPSWSRT
jgi:hypothetical protein